MWGFQSGKLASAAFNVQQKYKRGLFSVWLAQEGHLI